MVFDTTSTVSEARLPMSSGVVKNEQSNTGVVFSGGAVKAVCFHFGVSKALSEFGYDFVGGQSSNGVHNRKSKTLDSKSIGTYVGSSSGSVVAALLASGHDPSKLSEFFFEKNNKSYSPFRKHHLYRPNISKNLKKSMTGVFTSAGVASYLKKNILPTDDFQKLKADLFCIASQLDGNKKTVFGPYSYLLSRDNHSCTYEKGVKISDAVGASTAVPPIFSPYEIKMPSGETNAYFDGEIRDTLHAHVAIDNGCDLVFCSHTHQPYHYAKEVGSLTKHGFSAILVQAIYQMVERKIETFKSTREKNENALNAVDRFCKENFMEENTRRKILAILEEKLGHSSSVKTIFIHPDPKDFEMFSGSPFSLNRGKMKLISDIGYKRSVEILSNELN